VIRKFNVSIERCDEVAKEIYIENIPDDYCALDLEFKLQDILGPSVYVCLGMGEMDFAAPSVVVVKFRDHNLAVWAAEKIEEEFGKELGEGGEGEGKAPIVVNWRLTRPDADLHWRKQVQYTGHK
jgi:hypothetical protein